MDAYSLKIFFDDLFRIYNNELSIIGRKYDYFDYCLDLLEQEDQNKYYSKNYFEKQFNNFPIIYFIKSSKNIKRHDSKDDIISTNFNGHINSKIDLWINQFLKEHDIRYDNLVLASLVLSLCRFMGTKTIYLEYIFNGRDNAKYSNIFGLVRRHLPLFFNLNSKILVKEFLNNINNNLYEAIRCPPNSISEDFMRFFNSVNPPKILFDFAFESKKEHDLDFISEFHDLTKSMIQNIFFIKIRVHENLVIDYYFDTNYYSYIDIKSINIFIQDYLTKIINNYSQILDEIV